MRRKLRAPGRSVVVMTMPVMVMLIVAVFAVVVLVSMSMAVLGHVDALVPVVLDEIHRRAAGAVAMAVFVPVLHMLGGRVDVHGCCAIRCWLHIHGLTMDQARCRVAANIDVTVEAGLSDADGHIVGVTGLCEQRQQQAC